MMGEGDATAVRLHAICRIGAPVSEPALVNVQLAVRDGLPLDQLKEPVEDLATNQLRRISELTGRLLAGQVDVF
jgi:S-adenosylmethionine synthetase